MSFKLLKTEKLTKLVFLSLLLELFVKSILFLVSSVSLSLSNLLLFMKILGYYVYVKFLIFILLLSIFPIILKKYNQNKLRFLIYLVTLFLYFPPYNINNNSLREASSSEESFQPSNKVDRIMTYMESKIRECQKNGFKNSYRNLKEVSIKGVNYLY